MKENLINQNQFNKMQKKHMSYEENQIIHKTKINKTIVSMLLMLLVCFSISPKIPVSTPILITAQAEVAINASKKTMCKGDTYKLKINGTTKKVTWKSSNKSVAVVDANGKVTAKKKGTATITGTIGKNNYTCKVTVNNSMVKPRKTTVAVNVTKTVTVWVDTKNLTQMACTVSNDNIKCTWGDWKSDACPLKIKGVIPGTTTVEVYNTNEKSAKSIITVKIKPAEATAYGSVTGNVTYHYNQYRGYVPDTNARVFLIPKNRNAKGFNIKYTDFTVLSSTLLKKYVYSGKVDGRGNYAINHVPTGQYVAVIVSENTTDGNWFNASDKKTFYTNRSKKFKNVLNDFSAFRLSKSIGMYQWSIGTLAVYKGEKTGYSHAFGYTYN